MPVQRYARILGVMFLLSMIGGGFGESYVPGKILVTGNAAASADNVAAHETLFRSGFAAYLVEALCDIAIALLLYVLLRPVQRDLSLLAAFLGLVGTAIFAVGEVFLLTLLVKTEGNRLAQLWYGYGANVSMLFYGVASILRGYLIFRSQYLPRFLGVLLVIAGLSFTAKTFTFVLAPESSSAFLLLPIFVAFLAMTVWFLAKGVDLAKWEERVAADVAPSRNYA